MLKKDTVDRERQALRTIQARNEKCRGGPAFSPMENIDGTNPIADSIQALQDSPLCWVSIASRDLLTDPTRVLPALADLYERAVQPWEQFRTVTGPINFSLVYGMSDAAQDAEPAPVYMRWPYGTFPAKIQHEARLRYFELASTTRYSVEDVPSKRGLEEVNPPCSPLDFRHLAGLAATVCISLALEQYEETLAEWAAAVHECAPGLPFKWLVQHDPGRVELILAAYLASPANDNGWAARAREDEAAGLAKNAEGWLALADMEDSHQAEIERTTTRAKVEATALTLERVRVEKSRSASVSAKNLRTPLTPKLVANHFNANQELAQKRGGQKRLVLDLVCRYKVSESTVKTNGTYFGSYA